MIKIKTLFDIIFLSFVILFAIKTHVGIYIDVETRLSYYFVYMIGLFVSTWLYVLMIRPNVKGR